MSEPLPLGAALLAAVRGPLVRKEIRSISRRRQTYFVRVLYVGLIGLVIGMFWTRMTRGMLHDSPSEYAQLGRDLFRSFAGLQMVFVALAAVAAGAGLIAREARTGTLQLLLLTPVGPLGIAYGKWLAALAQAGSLLLCGVPVVSICLYLGGVGWWELAWSLILAMAQAAVAAAFALCHSASTRSPAQALLMSLLSLAIYAPWPAMALAFGSPIFTLFNAGASFGLALLVLRSTAKWLEEAPSREGMPEPGALERERERPLRSVWERYPLLWKDLATRAAARTSGEARLIVVLLAVLGLLFSIVGIGGPSPVTLFVAGGILFAWAILIGPSLFAAEREAGQWDPVLSSPVGRARVVGSKLLSGVVSPESGPVLLLSIAALASCATWAGARGAAVAAAVVLLFTAFIYLLGAASSLLARTLRSAFLFTVAVSALILAVLPIACSQLSPDGHALAFPGILTTVTNPVTVLEFVRRSDECAFIPFVAIYARAIAVVLAVMALRFDRAVGRR